MRLDSFCFVIFCICYGSTLNKLIIMIIIITKIIMIIIIIIIIMIIIKLIVSKGEIKRE